MLLLLACSSPTPPPAAPTPEPTAAAAPKSPKSDVALTPEQRRAYQAALDAGRKAHKAKDYPAAVTHFGEALALAPDDPRALSERGWARLQAGQLTEAQADTMAASARTTDRQLLGSAWYNLGRIQEAGGKKDDAATAYRVSLGFRPNEIVAKRLESLGIAAPTPFSATPMRGPWPTLDAWCAERKKSAEEPGFVCDPTGKELGEYEGPNTAAGAPFEEVRLVAAASPLWEDGGFTSGTVSYTLAVRTSAGWFTADDVTYAYNPGAFGIFEGVSGETLEVRNGRVVFQFLHARHDSDLGINEVETSDERDIVVCGMGGATPACVGPVMTWYHSERTRLMDEDEEPGIEHTFFDNGWDGKATVTDDGVLEITGPADPPTPGLVGRHPLVFTL